MNAVMKYGIAVKHETMNIETRRNKSMTMKPGHAEYSISVLRERHRRLMSVLALPPMDELQIDVANLKEKVEALESAIEDLSRYLPVELDGGPPLPERNPAS